MVERLVLGIAAADGVGFIVLVGYVRYRVTHGARLSPRHAAQIVLGYFSFFSTSTFFPLLWVNPGATAVVMLVLLVAWWGIGYPWTLWVLKNVFKKT